MTRIGPVEHGSKEYDKTVELRREVLRRPLGLDFTPEQLAAERDDLHLAHFQDGEVLGCLILTRVDDATLRMRQVAIHPDHQRRGLGLNLVEAAEVASSEQGFRRMILHARKTAVPFYVRLGYRVEGEPFEEVGLPHRAMSKSLG